MMANRTWKDTPEEEGEQRAPRLTMSVVMQSRAPFSDEKAVGGGGISRLKSSKPYLGKLCRKSKMLVSRDMKGKARNTLNLGSVT